MIPQAFIEQWREHAPWQTLSMIEQDLVITRALVNLFQHEVIKNAMVFRGGTALNKLFFKPPARFSEDIDLVQIRAEPIGSVLNAIRQALHWLGEPKRQLTQRSAKLIYPYTSIEGKPIKLKIEINTTEHFQVLPIEQPIVNVDNEWFSGTTTLNVYHLDELMGTKLRALYQRRKGRDLFDLWLAIHKDMINCAQVVAIFQKYNEHNGVSINRALFEQSLADKLIHHDFIYDMQQLLSHHIEWSLEKAAQRVQLDLIAKLPGTPWKTK